MATPQSPPIPKTPEPLKLSADELQKVARSRQRHAGTDIDPEWLFIAEFGYYYGWAGVQAILNNEITRKVAETLLEAARKVFYKQNFHLANGTFVATLAGVRSNRPIEAFNDGMKSYRKAAAGSR